MVRKKGSERLKDKKETLKRVNFTLTAPEAQSVALAGNFNGWTAHIHPLKRDSKGIWKIRINLKPGNYQYRFLVDGEWKDDPNCTTFTPNPFGSFNSVLTVK